MKNKLTTKIEIAYALYRVGRKFGKGKWQAVWFAMCQIKPRQNT